MKQKTVSKLKKEKSIFEMSERESRKRIVDAINLLHKRIGELEKKEKDLTNLIDELTTRLTDLE